MYINFFKKEKFVNMCFLSTIFVFLQSQKNKVSLAQLVEQLTLNQWVQGSSP